MNDHFEHVGQLWLDHPFLLLFLQSGLVFNKRWSDKLIIDKNHSVTVNLFIRYFWMCDVWNHSITCPEIRIISPLKNSLMFMPPLMWNWFSDVYNKPFCKNSALLTWSIAHVKLVVKTPIPEMANIAKNMWKFMLCCMLDTNYIINNLLYVKLGNQ